MEGGGIHYIWGLSTFKNLTTSKWLWLFNDQGPSFALLDWYNQTLRFSCNIIVIIYEGIDIWRLSILKKIKTSNMRCSSYKLILLNWYNQTLRFSCNNIVIIYEEIHHIWRLSILKIYCKWLWLFNYQGPSFAFLDWYNQTLRFSCNIIVIIYEGIDIYMKVVDIEKN